MHRILISIVLIAVPTWSFAQSDTGADVAAKPAAVANVAASAAAGSNVSTKSRNRFGQVMAELTRAAREQAAASRSSTASARPAQQVGATPEVRAVADIDRP